VEPINVWDYERLAEQKLDANAHAYFAGGAGDEVTLRENVAAFERRKLRPRVLVDVGTVTTSTTVLGEEIALPVLIAPLAMQRMAHPDGEEATARAAAAAGTIMCLSSAATSPPKELTDGRRWFQVYVWRSREKTEALIEEAVASGYSALVLTVDVPYLGRRERDVRVDFKVPEHLTVQGELFGEGFDATMSWRDLEWLAGYGLPVVIKGLLTAEDAQLACEHGAAAVVVSNHGGRQLDGVPATLDVLEEVVQAVDGAVPTYSRRSRSVRGPSSSAGRCSGASRSPAKRASRTCSSCSRRRSSWAWRYSAARRRATSVVHTCNELTAPHDLHRGSGQPHLVARVGRKQHLVAGLDAA
jgi:4-hydroxymandelate oxidase